MKCGVMLFLCVALNVVVVLPAAASVYGDDYPIQINGCRDSLNPGGLPFRCNPKGSPLGKYIDPWGEYNRDCTSFVAWRLSSKNGFEMPFDTRAQNWGMLAELMNYSVDDNPVVGAVAWDATNGHVAWVAEVYGNTVTLEEYSAYINGKKDGRYHLRTVSVDKYKYIHFRDIPRGGNAALQDAGIVYERGYQ